MLSNNEIKKEIDSGDDSVNLPAASTFTTVWVKSEAVSPKREVNDDHIDDGGDAAQTAVFQYVSLLKFVKIVTS